MWNVLVNAEVRRDGDTEEAHVIAGPYPPGGATLFDSVVVYNGAAIGW